MQGTAKPDTTTDTDDAFFAEAEALFQARRNHMWLLALEAGFTTRPGDPYTAVDEATALLAESDARLVTFVENWVAAALGGAS